MMIEHDGDDLQRLAHEDHRIEEHPDGHEEEHGERVLQRQRVGGGLVAEIRLADHDAREEGAERERDTEERGRADGDAERDREHAEREELARARPGHALEEPRDRPAADDEHEGDEGRDLGERPADRRGQATRSSRPSRGSPPSGTARAGSSTSTSTVTRSSTMSQPTAMRPSAGLERAAVLERPQEHHRARDREAEAEHEPDPQRPAPDVRDEHAEQGRDGDLRRARPGTAILRTASRSASEKCRPTPNISRMTPISASWAARPASATKPGVNGPTAMPASR